MVSFPVLSPAARTVPGPKKALPYAWIRSVARMIDAEGPIMKRAPGPYPHRGDTLVWETASRL